MCFVVKVRERGGKMRQIFPAPRWGAENSGRGVQLCVPLSFVRRVPPLLYNIYTLWFPTGWLPGRGRFRPRPGLPFLPETQKAVSSAVDTQHRLISQSEHNKPYLPFPPLKNPGRVGIIRLRCSRMTVVLSGRDTLHRPVEW